MRRRYDDGSIERVFLTGSKNNSSTFVFVVAIIILLPVLIWALAISIDILAAVPLGIVIIGALFYGISLFWKARIGNS